MLEMESLLESIRYNDGKFPREKLQQLIDNKEDAIPHLIAIVEELINDPDAFLDEPTRIDHIYSLFFGAISRNTAVSAAHPVIEFPRIGSRLALRRCDYGRRGPDAGIRLYG